VAASFNEDNYLFDLYENDEVAYLVQKEIVYGHIFAQEDLDCLKALRTFDNLGVDEEKCLCQLLDLLFAWLYENRVMDNDMSKESGVTINKLSSLLSCHVVDETLDTVMLSCY